MAAVARKNGSDSILTGHAGSNVTYTDEGSNNVFVNGEGVVRFGDLQQQHEITVGLSTANHAFTLSSSSLTVFVNGKGAGRKGDDYNGEIIISGSNDVFFGD